MDRRRFADLSLKTGIAAAVVSAIPGLVTLRGRTRATATQGRIGWLSGDHCGPHR